MIVVQGAISGAAKVSVTSDKTVVGKAGSCMSTFMHSHPMSAVDVLLTPFSSHWYRPDYPWPKECDRQEPEDIQSSCNLRRRHHHQQINKCLGRPL